MNHVLYMKINLCYVSVIFIITPYMDILMTMFSICMMEPLARHYVKLYTNAIK